MGTAAGATTSPTGGGAPAAAGYLLDSTVLLTVPQAGLPAARATSSAGTVVDCLLLGQRTPPVAGTFQPWFDAYTAVLSQLGWVVSASSNLDVELQPAHWFGGKTAVPWPKIRDDVLTDSPVAAYTGQLTTLVDGLDELPAKAAARWESLTSFGTSACAAVAVAVLGPSGCELVVTAAWVSYPAGAKPDKITGFPGQPVSTRDAKLTTATAQLTVDAATLAALQPQIDPLVAPVRSVIVPLPL